MILERTEFLQAFDDYVDAAREGKRSIMEEKLAMILNNDDALRAEVERYKKAFKKAIAELENPGVIGLCDTGEMPCDIPCNECLTKWALDQLDNIEKDGKPE